jgi:hypothetical protein
MAEMARRCAKCPMITWNWHVKHEDNAISHQSTPLIQPSTVAPHRQAYTAASPIANCKGADQVPTHLSQILQLVGLVGWLTERKVVVLVCLRGVVVRSHLWRMSKHG